MPLIIGGGFLGLCVVSALIGSALTSAVTGTQNAAGNHSQPAAAASSAAALASSQALPSPQALAPAVQTSAPPSPKAQPPAPKPSSKPPTRKPSPKPQSTCDPNYAGACVPIASDVDCGGGSGNGPAYFYGVATVVGTDIYDLDRDNDGLACEKG